MLLHSNASYAISHHFLKGSGAACQHDFTFIPNTFAHLIFCLPTFTGQLRALFTVLKLNYLKAAFWNGWRYIRFIDKLLTALLIQLQNGGSCLSLLVRRGTISAFCLVHNDAAVCINVQNDTRTILACGVLTIVKPLFEYFKVSLKPISALLLTGWFSWFVMSKTMITLSHFRLVRASEWIQSNFLAEFFFFLLSYA